MTVSKADAQAWTAVGSQDAAKRAYDSVKKALRDSKALAKYILDVDYEVFLQGSYANSTNTRGDSDVDVVVMLTSTYMPDTSHLSVVQKSNFEARRVPGSTTPLQFRLDVEAALREYYPASRVESRNKCLFVAKSDGYVDADIVPVLQERVFTTFNPDGSSRYVEGIRIRPLSGPDIVNFPKVHLANGQAKNEKCRGSYKPTVRQVKRLRRLAVDRGVVRKGVAPGYLLECLVSNAPNDLFDSDDAMRLIKVMAFRQNQSPEELRDRILSCDGINTLFQTDPGNFNQYTAANFRKAMWEIL